MKPITNGKKPFLIISIEKDAFDFNIEQGRKQKVLSMSLKRPMAKFGFSEFKVSLRTNKKLTLLGKLSELTEEQAAELVIKLDVSFGALFFDYISLAYIYTNSKESLKFLLQSNDCWLKEWIEKPVYSLNINDNVKKYTEFNKASEDFLIILID